MKVLLVGASGVLGRALLPHLHTHEVVGTTRTPGKLGMLRALGATGVVCDIYETGSLDNLARGFRPHLVINFLTDLSLGPGPLNTRIRREGGPVVASAARAAGARGLVVESIGFATPPRSAEAVSFLEQNALASGISAWVLRFGRLWGPGTWDATAPMSPCVHVETAGILAAQVILGIAPGVYIVEDGGVTAAFTP